MTNEEFNGALRQEFQNAQTILIVSHIRPDGDAVDPLPHAVVVRRHVPRRHGRAGRFRVVDWEQRQEGAPPEP